MIKSRENKKTNNNMYQRVIDSIVREENQKKMNDIMGYAAERGCQHIVDESIKCGANDWNHGMVQAAAGGHINIVKFFVSKGANSWLAAKYEAVRNNHQELIKYFASIDEEDMIYVYGISLFALENTSCFQDLHH